jgi:hypothetical protein
VDGALLRILRPARAPSPGHLKPQTRLTLEPSAIRTRSARQLLHPAVSRRPADAQQPGTGRRRGESRLLPGFVLSALLHRRRRSCRGPVGLRECNAVTAGSACSAPSHEQAVRTRSLAPAGEPAPRHRKPTHAWSSRPTTRARRQFPFALIGEERCRADLTPVSCPPQARGGPGPGRSSLGDTSSRTAARVKPDRDDPFGQRDRATRPHEDERAIVRTAAAGRSRLGEGDRPPRLRSGPSRTTIVSPMHSCAVRAVGDESDPGRRVWAVERLALRARTGTLADNAEILVARAMQERAVPQASRPPASAAPACLRAGALITPRPA